MAAVFWESHLRGRTESEERIRLRQITTVLQNRKSCREGRGEGQKNTSGEIRDTLTGPGGQFSTDLCIFSLKNV